MSQQSPPLPPIHEAWLPREHSLHRPRHGGRQLTALICALVFFATPTIALVMGARATEFENRALTGFPSLGAGFGLFEQLPVWATDHMALRKEAIDAAIAISRGLFGEPLPFDTPGSRTGPIPGGRLSPPQRPPHSIPVGPVIEGVDGWLYLGHEVEVRCNMVTNLDETFARLRRLRDGVEASGRQFVLVVAPDKIVMEPDHLPPDLADEDCINSVTEQFWRLVDASEFVVNLRGPLQEWKKRRGRPIYPKLDAHWTDEGGVELARSIAEAVEPGVTSTWKVTEGEQWVADADLPHLIRQDGKIIGRHYGLRPDGTQDETREVTRGFNTPLRLTSTPMIGKVSSKVGLLADSFTIRSLRYLTAAFSDLTVLHHDSLTEDYGVLAGQMLADQEVVAVEVAERSVIRPDSVLVDPRVITVITSELAKRPLG